MDVGKWPKGIQGSGQNDSIFQWKSQVEALHNVIFLAKFYSQPAQHVLQKKRFKLKMIFLLLLDK